MPRYHKQFSVSEALLGQISPNLLLIGFRFLFCDDRSTQASPGLTGPSSTTHCSDKRFLYQINHLQVIRLGFGNWPIQR